MKGLFLRMGSAGDIHGDVEVEGFQEEDMQKLVKSIKAFFDDAKKPRTLIDVKFSVAECSNPNGRWTTCTALVFYQEKAGTFS